MLRSDAELVLQLMPQQGAFTDDLGVTGPLAAIALSCSFLRLSDYSHRAVDELRSQRYQPIGIH